MPRIIVYTLPRNDHGLAPMELLSQTADAGCLHNVDPFIIQNPQLIEYFREHRLADDIGVLWIDIDREGAEGLRSVAQAEDRFKNWLQQARHAYSTSQI